MKTVRYLGPLAGVEGGVLPSPVAVGDTIALADEIVDGRAHQYADGYTPETVDGELVIDSDMIIEPGTSGLLAQTYEDADGNVLPCWEVVESMGAKAAKAKAAHASPAPE